MDAITTVPISEKSALDAYCDLDLNASSALCRSLAKAVEEEQADEGRLNLTDELGPYPPGFTPQMLSWYQGEVGPARTAALNEVQSAFEGAVLSQTSAGKGMMIPAAKAKNDQERLIAYNLVHTDYRRDHQHLIDKRESRRAEFEQKRAEHGNRDPVLTTSWYYFGLIVVVLLEIGVNVESMLQLPWITSPFFATSAAVLVGLAVGFAAHLHGSVLKQWHYWFQSHDPTRVWKASRKIAIGGSLLTVSLALIAWARYYYVAPQIEIAIIQGSEPPSMVLSIMFMTLTNIIVYGVGVVLAYFCHDEDPEYPPKKIELDKANKAVARSKYLIDAKLKLADDRWDAERKKLEVFERSQTSSPQWEVNRKALARLISMDERVEAALNRYKTNLVAHLRKAGEKPVFVQATVTRDDAGREERLSAEQYLAKPVKLRMV